MACLTENQLLDHASGRLDAARARAAEEHLDGCADCRAVLATLVSSGQGDGAARAPDESRASAGVMQERTIISGGSVGDDLPRGTSLDRYVILKRVGGGAMGVVYAALDPRLDRTIAIKMVREDVAATMSKESRARILREAQAMARLNHPNVVTVHDVGTYEGRLYLAMEYLDEGTLASWLTQKPRDWAQVVEAFAQAGRGLAAAHALGLVHRDFKPQNVMVAKDGRVRITDFGLVRPSDALARPDELTRPDMEMPTAAQLIERLTRMGALVGTPRYMAPEQLAGQDVDARADQFAFCVALWEAVYGTFPFQLGDSGGLRRAIEQGRFLRPAPGRRAPQWLRRVLVRGLSATPQARFPTMDALLDALRQGRERVRRRGLIAAVAASLALTAGLAVAATRMYYESRAAQRAAGSATSP